MVHGGIAPRPVGGQGSGAARALYRFSQSNAPETKALLSDRSERASQASRTIAAKSVSLKFGRFFVCFIFKEKKSNSFLFIYMTIYKIIHLQIKFNTYAISMYKYSSKIFCSSYKNDTSMLSR